MESSNLEMVKRLKYTKDILTHMLNANVNTGKPGGPGMDTNSNVGAQSQSSRPKTNTLTSAAGLGLGDQNSKGQLSTSNKFSATDRINMKPYQTTQNFGTRDMDGAFGDP
jgi:hypothetical protein